MAQLSELQFAQKYPFSSVARKIVKESNVSFDDMPEELLQRAILLVSNASKGKKYSIPALADSDVLLREVLAFPIAKIFIAMQKNQPLNQKFCQMIADSAFRNISIENRKLDVAMDLSKDLGFKMDLSPLGEFCISINLIDFLKMDYFKASMKLVNHNVERGKIFLNENSFSKFVSEMVYAKTMNSLNEPIGVVPKNFREISTKLSQQLLIVQKKEFEFKMHGTIDPNAFPPCYADFYSQLLVGKNLPHLARFSIASFLLAIGMQVSQIIDLFRKTPNFSEKMTSYQVNRLAKTKISPPSCNKIREYGLCNSMDCIRGNPLKYYSQKMNEIKKAEMAEQEKIKKAEKTGNDKV